jgi:hypothetical protein
MNRLVAPVQMSADDLKHTSLTRRLFPTKMMTSLVSTIGGKEDDIASMGPRP